MESFAFVPGTSPGSSQAQHICRRALELVPQRKHIRKGHKAIRTTLRVSDSDAEKRGRHHSNDPRNWGNTQSKNVQIFKAIVSEFSWGSAELSAPSVAFFLRLQLRFSVAGENSQRFFGAIKSQVPGPPPRKPCGFSLGRSQAIASLFFSQIALWNPCLPRKNSSYYGPQNYDVNNLQRNNSCNCNLAPKIISKIFFMYVMFCG